MKKILKSIFIVVLICMLISPVCFAADKEEKVDLKEQVKKEDGSLFEKIIAECIGGLAQTVFDFTTGEDANVGFKDYDELIFNGNTLNDSLSPFTEELWNKTMKWYSIFAVLSGSLILIAIFILAYKIIAAGMNTARKNEAKESLMRLCFGGVAIALAPIFIRLLLFLNNSMVYLILNASNNASLGDKLGSSMLTSISTGNAIATALVIAMFIYLFVKLNIKFIVRQFTIIIFTIFTPVAAGLWIINKNVTAASIWAGQLIMNIFMQFIYCFLFLIYLAFLPSGGGWAVSLIWAMMILPLADALQNCFQNLTSRIAGIDNEQMTNRVVGMGAMLGFGLGAIKEQFNSPSSNNNGGNNGNGGLKGFIDRAKSVVNPSMNLSPEKDYSGNVNPIRTVLPKENSNETNVNNNISIPTSNGTATSPKSIAGKVAKTGFNATKAYLSMGAKMAEGDFSKSPYKNNNQQINRKSNYQNVEYMQNAQKLANENIAKKLGDQNEPKE